MAAHEGAGLVDRRGRTGLNRLVAEPAAQIGGEKRGVGMMFQDYALFPHLTVARNVGFGLGRRPPAEAQARVAAMLDLVGLSGQADAYPHELSGGQQQRVALARALVMNPRLLLADEPTGNLDHRTGNAIHDLVMELNRERGMTMVVVTHNEDLAMRLPRRVLMLDGRVVDAPRAVPPSGRTPDQAALATEGAS